MCVQYNFSVWCLVLFTNISNAGAICCFVLTGKVLATLFCNHNSEACLSAVANTCISDHILYGYNVHVQVIKIFQRSEH